MALIDLSTELLIPIQIFVDADPSEHAFVLVSFHSALYPVAIHDTEIMWQLIGIYNISSSSEVMWSIPHSSKL